MKQEQLEVLQTAEEYTQRLYAGVMSASEYYRTGKITKGHTYVAMITEGLEWLVDVVQLISDRLVEPIEVSKMNELGEELIDAMENEDTVLIADLLEYEMAEEIEKWQGVLAGTVNQAAIELCHEA